MKTAWKSIIPLFLISALVLGGISSCQFFQTDSDNNNEPTSVVSSPTGGTTATPSFRIVNISVGPSEFDEFCAWSAPGRISVNIPQAGEYLLTAALGMGDWRVVFRVYPEDGVVVTIDFEPLVTTNLAPIIITAILQPGEIVAPPATEAQVVQEADYPSDQTWIFQNLLTVFAWPSGGIGSWDVIFRADPNTPWPLVTNTVPHTCGGSAPPTPTPTVTPTAPPAPTPTVTPTATPTTTPTVTPTPTPTATPTTTPTVTPTPTPTPNCSSTGAVLDHGGFRWVASALTIDDNACYCRDVCAAAGQGTYDPAAGGYFTDGLYPITEVNQEQACRALVDGLFPPGGGPNASGLGVLDNCDYRPSDGRAAVRYGRIPVGWARETTRIRPIQWAGSIHEVCPCTGP